MLWLLFRDYVKAWRMQTRELFKGAAFYRPEREVIVTCSKVVGEQYLSHYGQVPIYGRWNKRSCKNMAAPPRIICQIRNWEKEGQVPVGHVMAWLVSERIFQSSYLENLVPDSAVHVWYFGEVIRSWRLSLPQWLNHWWVPNLIGYLEVMDTSRVGSNWR